ncbi:MAG: hypothetical protein CBB97_09110 [Candidatus Endolissoclinum sp. TMED37]|nr:MAG: hypothetical protein CBB97_09110 [Candidatus Endolissoclinum sp. TMED37]
MKKKILCTICARKGSKGLPNKNILNLLGKPLIYHSLDQAKKINLFSKIVVSSNSNKILKISKKKVDYCIKRPEKLSGDHSSKIQVIKHALIESEKKFKILFDYIVDLDVTSPLRSKKDISNAIKIILKKKGGNLVSGYDARRSPYFNQVTFKNKKLSLVCNSKKKITRRQDVPKIFDLNASIYIWTRKSILTSNKLINNNTIFFKMPYLRSVDIDDKSDFMIVEFILKKNLNR